VSFDLTARIIGDTDIKDRSEFTVLLALADATNKEDQTCYLGLSTIGRVARIDRRSAIRTISSLEKKRWIQVTRERRPSSRDNLPNVYVITKYGGGVVSLGSGVVSLGVVAPGHQGSDKSHAEVVAWCHPNQEENQEYNQEEKKEPLPASPESEPEPSDKKRPRCLDDVIAFVESDPTCRKEFIDKKDAAAWYGRRTEANWKKKGGETKDWRQEIRTWANSNWFPSQKLPTGEKKSRKEAILEEREAERRTV
jgi:hypothetical protein